MKITRAELARQCEIALTRPDAMRPDVERFCQEARGHGLRAVAVSGSRVELARTLLEDTSLKVLALVGFPLGTADGDVKRYETEVAVDHGAQEIELVVNMGRLKEGDNRSVLRELRDVVEAADERPVTAIFEFRFLDDEQKRTACELISDSGVKVFSVATGLLGAARVEDVRIVRELLGDKTEVKAAGVHDTISALALLEAGATRLSVIDPEAVLAGAA